MKNRNEQALFDLALFLGIVLIILLFFLLQSHFSFNTDSALAICGPLAIALIALYIYERHVLKTQKMIHTMKEAVKSILSDPGNNEHPLFMHNTAEIKAFYEQVDVVKESFKKIENDQQEFFNIISSIAVNIEFDKLLQSFLPKLVEITKSHCCAFYLVNPATNKLELKQSVGFSKNIYREFDITLGEGYIGEAANSKKITVFNSVPDDTIYIIRTFLGKIKPKSIMSVPITNQDELSGVLVLASIYDYTEEQVTLVEHIKYYLGIAVANGAAFDKTVRLTNELKFQNMLIQDLNLELANKAQDRSMFLDNIINSVKDTSIFSMDKSGVIIMWNVGAELMFGYTAKDIIGKHVSTLYSPEEAAKVQSRIDFVVKNGKLTESGWRTKADGSSYYYEMEIFCMYNDNGNIIGLTNITRDITILRNFESIVTMERMISLKLLDTSTMAAVITDERGIIQMSNSKALIMFNRDTMTGTGIYEYFSNWKEVYDELYDAIANSRDITTRHKIKKPNENMETESADMRIYVLNDPKTSAKRTFIYLTKCVPESAKIS